MLKDELVELYGETAASHINLEYIQKYIYEKGFQCRVELLEDMITVECSRFGDGWFSDQKENTQYRVVLTFETGEMKQMDVDKLILSSLTAAAEWVHNQTQPETTPTVKAVAIVFGIEVLDIYDIVIYDTGVMDILFLDYDTAAKYGLGRVRDFQYHEKAKFAIQESQDAFVIKAIQTLYDVGILAFLRRGSSWIVKIVDERTSVTYTDEFYGEVPMLPMIDAIENWLYRDSH